MKRPEIKRLQNDAAFQMMLADHVEDTARELRRRRGKVRLRWFDLRLNIESEGSLRCEIEYFIQCVKENRQPTTVTLEDGAEAVRMVEAEVESIRTGWPVSPTAASKS